MPLSAVRSSGFPYDGISFRIGNPSLSHKAGSNTLNMGDIIPVVFPRPAAGAKLLNAATVRIYNRADWRLRTLIEQIPNAILVAVNPRPGENGRVRAGFVSVIQKGGEEEKSR